MSVRIKGDSNGHIFGEEQKSFHKLSRMKGNVVIHAIIIVTAVIKGFKFGISLSDSDLKEAIS
jgi:hypothetical protein